MCDSPFSTYFGYCCNVSSLCSAKRKNHRHGRSNILVSHIFYAKSQTPLSNIQVSNSKSLLTESADQMVRLGARVVSRIHGHLEAPAQAGYLSLDHVWQFLWSILLHFPHLGWGRAWSSENVYICLFGWLVGFLTSSSTTRLYRGRAPRQSI